MHPLPPAPPDRADAAAFHYHTYSYPGDGGRGAFRLSDGLASAEDARFYSLIEDLQGLAAWGNTKNVPNLRLTAMSAMNGGARTIEGRDTLMLSFGGPAPGPGVQDVPAVVFTGGIHAREWIAVEFVYLLAEYLIKHYSTAPQDDYQRTIQSLIDNRRIYLLPMLNPDGNHYTVFTGGGAGRKWRKNRRPLPKTPAEWVYLLTGGGTLGFDPPPFRNVEVPEEPIGALAEYDVPVYEVRDGALRNPPQRHTWELASGQTGVDLNRNFRTLAWGYDGWGYPPGGPPVPGGSCNPSDLGYFGSAAASEAETANAQVAFAHAAAAPGIAVSIDYHSRAQFILFPTEMSDYGRVSSNYAKLGVTLWNLVRCQAALDYQLGTPRDLFHADATGTVMDYAAQAHQSQAFTIELDPTLEVEDGWLLPEGNICGVFEKNIRGALAALAAPLNPGNPYAAEQIYAQILKKFLSWNVYDRGNRLPL